MATSERVEAVYRSAHPKIWRALLAVAGDPDLASDAESEAFAQALRRGAAIDDVERWVWKSAFRILDGLLAARRRPAPIDHDTTPTIDSADAEFLSMLGDLTTQQRQIVVLRYVGQFNAAEIAELLDSSPGSVRVQLHRAHESLRSSLTEGKTA
ncbi:MAG: sigma-70 family RNA polymerase sigma factor [Ilumatobacter sp.]|uniref:RNA polymerase sigma factor n=1 Tax=Ilumatobacter sp. TaxID=1967498 RepID=UPI003C721D4F